MIRKISLLEILVSISLFAVICSSLIYVSNGWLKSVVFNGSCDAVRSKIMLASVLCFNQQDPVRLYFENKDGAWVCFLRGIGSSSKASIVSKEDCLSGVSDVVVYGEGAVERHMNCFCVSFPDCLYYIDPVFVVLRGMGSDCKVLFSKDG